MTETPQSGDLWQHPLHGRMLFTDFSGDLLAWDMQESGHALTGLDMTGATRLYPAVLCPSCEHRVDDHAADGCVAFYAWSDCACTAALAPAAVDAGQA